MAEGSGGWHLSKGLSVSHILSTAVIAVGFFTYVTDIEQKTMINEIAMDRTNKRHSEEFGEIKEMLKHLTVKIDNLGHRRER